MRCGGSPSEELASGSHPPVVVPPLEGEGPPRREHPLIQVCRLLLCPEDQRSKPATQELGQLITISVVTFLTPLAENSSILKDR